MELRHNLTPDLVIRQEEVFDKMRKEKVWFEPECLFLVSHISAASVRGRQHKDLSTKILSCWPIQLFSLRFAFQPSQQT